MGSEVGSAYVSIYPDTSHFQDKLEDELNGMTISSSGQSIGRSLADGVSSGFSPITVMLGNLMSSAIEGAVNLFTQHLGRGIERLDTIKNFPRLMSTFGYSTDVAAESVQNIQNHLMGLPGSTDEVLRLVQAISDSTGSLELATSTGLAFNDMLTASGADAYTSMMAMRMFDQMMGGAQFTTMRWMALVSKMPLQMNMVAEAILGTGASAQELGTALQNGEVTMKDVAEAMTELGPQFTVQAKAFSYGVGTAVRNFGNRIVLGIAAILDAVGQFHISNVINDISTGIKDALVFIAGGVEWLRRVFLVSGIGVLMKELGESIKEWFLGIDWEPLKELARFAIGALHDGLQWLIDNGDIARAIIAGIIGFALGDWLSNVAKQALGLGESIGKLVLAFSAHPFLSLLPVILAVAAGLVYFFTQTERGREIISKVFEFIKNVISTIGPFIMTVFQMVSVFLTALVQVIIDAFSFVWNALVAVIEGIIGAVQSIWSFLGEAWDAGSQLFLIIAGYIEGVIAALFDVIGNILTTAIEAWDSMWTFVDWVCQGIVDVIAALVGAVFDAAKQFVTDCQNTFNKIKSLVETFRLNLKTTFSNIKTTVLNIWDGIKSGITNAINGAKDTVKKAIDAIKGFFNFRFQWPHIPLPHFSISGSANPLDWITGGLPKISVQWYGKGGFVNGATLIGAGEKGGEFIWPSYGPYLSRYARALVSEMGGGGTVNNYYIDGNLVAADAVLGAALDTVAQCVDARRRMGVA